MADDNLETVVKTVIDYYCINHEPFTEHNIYSFVNELIDVSENEVLMFVKRLFHSGRIKNYSRLKVKNDHYLYHYLEHMDDSAFTDHKIVLDVVESDTDQQTKKHFAPAADMWEEWVDKFLFGGFRL